MTFEEFDKFTEALIADIRKMRDTKGKEYAREKNDRFGNFNRLAARLGIDREKVAMIYLTKHLDAIESFIDHHREFSTEKIRGRCIDAMTYISLLAGMFEENSTKEYKSSGGTITVPSIPRIELMEIESGDGGYTRYVPVAVPADDIERLRHTETTKPNDPR